MARVSFFLYNIAIELLKEHVLSIDGITLNDSRWKKSDLVLTSMSAFIVLCYPAFASWSRIWWRLERTHLILAMDIFSCRWDKYATWLHHVCLWLHYLSLWLHSVSVWLHFVSLWLHYVSSWLHSVTVWLHSGTLWLHSVTLWLHSVYLWLHSVTM
jgi:hypothetical protein